MFPARNCDSEEYYTCFGNTVTYYYYYYYYYYTTTTTTTNVMDYSAAIT